MDRLRQDVLDSIIPENELVPGGAFGRIYRVQTNVINTPVVAKVFKGRLPYADREYQVLQDLAQFDDPRFSTPTPYDVVSLPLDRHGTRQAAVVMEYIDGVSFDDMTVGERAPFRPLLEGLVEALVELGISRGDGPKLSELIIRGDGPELCMLDAHSIKISGNILQEDLYSDLLRHFDEQEKHVCRDWYMHRGG